MKAATQQILLDELAGSGVDIFIRREDMIHPFVSGNKYRKLKYNLAEAVHKGYGILLTFGGAFSNHIAATAYATQIAGLKSVGIIRGEELREKWNQNPTLQFAHQNGMEFRFVDRDTYRLKTDPGFLSALEREYGRCYLLPEGGTNALAIKGCEEILNASDHKYDYICCAVGTGGTMAGIVRASTESQYVLGFSSLKGDFLKGEIRRYTLKENWEVNTAYHWGGYAKTSPELIAFINRFKEKTGIPLDPIYTGKMMYGIVDLVKQGTFVHGTKILAIHTGGLQGIAGMNELLKKKRLPIIQ